MRMNTNIVSITRHSIHAIKVVLDNTKYILGVDSSFINKL